MPSPRDPGLPGVWARQACLWEATAPKAGNVHPAAFFPDLTYRDFVRSAGAIAPVFARAIGRRVGTTVLDAIRATRAVVNTNTNLGMVLLLAPLAAVPLEEELRPGLERVLDDLSLADTQDVYAAIRLAKPGGLGAAPCQDVGAEPTLPLRAVMALAADWDLVARQYADGFRAVFDAGVPAIRSALARGLSLDDAIVATHLHLLAAYPDTLIARKRGLHVALEASRRARDVIGAGWPETMAGVEAFRALDDWLRAEDNSRNPGACADLTAAGLFVALREGDLPLT